MKLLKNLSSFVVVFLFAGCLVNRPYVHEETTSTNTSGVVTLTKRTMKTTTGALWPASGEIAKQNVAASPKSWKIGQVGIDGESTGGTNGVEALRVVDSILGKVRP